MEIERRFEDGRCSKGSPEKRRVSSVAAVHAHCHCLGQTRTYEHCLLSQAHAHTRAKTPHSITWSVLLLTCCASCLLFSLPSSLGPARSARPSTTSSCALRRSSATLAPTPARTSENPSKHRRVLSRRSEREMTQAETGSVGEAGRGRACARQAGRGFVQSTHFDTRAPSRVGSSWFRESALGHHVCAHTADALDTAGSGPGLIEWLS